MRSIGRASAVAIVARGLTLVLGLSCTALLSRTLSADALAAYWIAVSALALVVLIAQTGVGQVAMSLASQAIARQDELQARRVSSNALAVVLLTGLVTASAGTATLASGIVLGGREVSSATLLFILVGGALCSVAMQLVDNLRAQQRLTTSAWLAAQPASGGVVPGIVLLAGLALLSRVSDVSEQAYALVYASFLGGWLLMLLLAAAVLSRPAPLAPSASLLSIAAVKSLLLASGPILSGALAMFIITQADLWFVNFHLGTDETAAYGLAATFVKYVSAANVMLGALLPGLVGQLWAQGEHARLAAVLVKVARLGAAAAALVVLAILFFGKQLLVAVAGPAYASAWLPLTYLAIGHLANSLLGYSQVLLVTAGVLRPIALASVAACLTTLAALALATPLWGMSGAAVASAAGVIVYNTITCLGCIRATGVACHVFARTNCPHPQSR